MTAPADGTAPVALLGPAQVRRLADAVGLRPTKQRGQNFVVDPNTVRRIVRLAEVTGDDTVLEVGPGLGSLTLALLEKAGHVTAVEVDPVLAAALPATVTERAPQAAAHLTTVTADALRLTQLPGPAPTALVANLPYNVAVPVLLSLLERFPTLERGLVMVQLEVAERLVASPGTKAYGVPSLKLAWWAQARLAGHGLPDRVLAGAERRLRPGGPGPPATPADDGHPARGLRLRRRRVRPAPQDPANRPGHVGRFPRSRRDRIAGGRRRPVDPRGAAGHHHLRGSRRGAPTECPRDQGP